MPLPAGCSRRVHRLIWSRGSIRNLALFVISYVCRSFKSLSFNVSLSIYPRLMPSARIINGDYLNPNLLIAPSLFIMSLCSRWSRWQPESLPALLQFSIPPLILACFSPVIIHNTGTPAVKSLSVCLCLFRTLR